MLTFLFWNLNGKNLAASLARLASKHSVDVLILAEATAPEVVPDSLLPVLNASAPLPLFSLAPDQCERIQMYTRFAPSLAVPVSEDAFHMIRHIRFPDRPDFLLVAAHLPSKLRDSEKSQYDEMLVFVREIQRMEAQVGHTRTIVVGDLNMNPFEYGVISAMRLHGVSSKTIARKGARKIRGKVYPFFYNPMWSRFGDQPERPPGTYHYRIASHECYFWNVFDQVLIRPSLLDFWDDRNLEVLTSDGEVNFLSRRGGLPGGRNRSDHLPLLFKLDL
jgi:hypothetical protein